MSRFFEALMRKKKENMILAEAPRFATGVGWMFYRVKNCSLSVRNLSKSVWNESSETFRTLTPNNIAVQSSHFLKTAF